MELNSLDDIDNNFPDEASARKYLVNLRWGQWARCPKCGNGKAYFIEEGTRYKCANNKCYYKFSVYTRTLMNCAKLPFLTWIKAVSLYVRKRSRIDGFEIAIECGVTDKTGVLIKHRLDFAWKYVDRTAPNLLEELFKKIFSLYDEREQMEKIVWSNPYHISEISNINDPKEFQILLNYAKLRLYFCTYIYINFASAGEIMTEVFLWMHDNKIKDYDADFMVKIINRTIARMWTQYKKDHPNLWKDHLAKQKERSRDARRNLKKRYLVERVKNREEYSHLTRGQIANAPEILSKIKEVIKEKRKKNNVIYDFESHFS